MGTIGVLSAYLGGEYCGRVTAALHAHARNHGHALMVIRTGSQNGSYRIPLGLARAESWAVVIESVDIALMMPLLERGVPVCTLGHDYGIPGVGCVQVDNVAGINSVMRRLYRDGHRQFAFIGCTHVADLAERLAAFAEYVHNAADCRPPLIEHAADHSFAAGRAAAARLIDGGGKFTALVCATDSNAQGAIVALRDRGLAVPGDVAVTGFDNAVFTRMPRESISTVDQDLLGLTRIAMEDLFTRSKDPSRRPVKLRHPPLFIPRRSSGDGLDSSIDELVDGDLVRSFLCGVDEVSFATIVDRASCISSYIDRLGPRLRYALRGRLDLEFGTVALIHSESTPAFVATSTPLADFPPDAGNGPQRLQAGDLLFMLVDSDNEDEGDAEVLALAFRGSSLESTLAAELVANEVENLSRQLQVYRMIDRLRLIEAQHRKGR